MAATTAEQKEALERAAAKATYDQLKALTDEYPGAPGSGTSVIDRIKQAVSIGQKFANEWKDVDIAKIADNVEKIKAAQDSIRQNIRLQKGGIYVPGLGEEKEKFSLVRAWAAITQKNWDLAPFENEVFKASREAITKTGAIVGVDVAGGFFVPDQVIADVIMAIYAKSVLIALDAFGVTRMQVINGLTGQPVKIPKFIGGSIAYWIGEQDKYVESAARTGNVTMTPKKMGVLTRITDEMKRFSSFGFEALLRNDMVRAAAALIDFTALYGSGTADVPRGLFNVPGTIQYWASTHSTTAPASSTYNTGGELTFDDLMNMQGAVEDQNIPIDPSWAYISAGRFFRRRRQDKIQYFSGQTSNFGYLLGAPMLTEDVLKGYIGDFGKLNVMPTQNTAGQSFQVGAVLAPNNSGDQTYGDVVATNWNDTMFGRWGGIEVVEDQGLGRGFATDESFVKLRMYGDIGYRRENTVVLAADAKMR